MDSDSSSGYAEVCSVQSMSAREARKACEGERKVGLGL